MSDDYTKNSAEIISKLYTAVLSDVLDDLGRSKQALAPYIRPLDDGLVAFGRARTGIFMDRYSVELGENPYDVEIEFIDDLNPGDFAALACNGPTTRIAPWGELLSTASAVRKAAGCVTDGLVRDIKRIRELEFPVFHGGIGPLDSRGRAKMMARDVPIEISGVPIRSNDYIFADADGVVVVPKEISGQVFDAAMEKVEAEDGTRRRLVEGATLASVFEEFGVL